MNEYLKAYGEVPKGYIIHHVNGISNDDRLENLVCITRKEHINIHRNDLKKHDNESEEQE